MTRTGVAVATDSNNPTRHASVSSPATQYGFSICLLMIVSFFSDNRQKPADRILILF